MQLRLIKLVLAIVQVLACEWALAGSLHSAIVPQYEHSEKSIHFSYFATLINDSNAVARNCRIEMDKGLPLKFAFYLTDPNTNMPNGEESRAVDIPAGQAQTFAFTVMFYRQLEANPRILYPHFRCDNLPVAEQIAGTNSLNYAGFDLDSVRWFTADEVEEFSDPLPTGSESYKVLAELSPEQASLIAWLNPERWQVYRSPLNTPVSLKGGKLGQIDVQALRDDPEGTTLQYLTELGVLTNVDARTRISIYGVVQGRYGRDSIISFGQVVHGVVQSYAQPSFIKFSAEGKVTSIDVTIAHHSDLPQPIIGAKAAIELAKQAVKDKYELWFLCLAEARGIDKNGTARKLFWYNRRQTKLIVGWEVRFLNMRRNRSGGIHTVLVDGATGEVRLKGRPQPYFGSWKLFPNF